METEMPVYCYLMGSLEVLLLPNKFTKKISVIIAAPLLWDNGDKEMRLLMTTSWK